MTLNCGYGQGYSVRQVVDMVGKVSGVDFEVREGPRRAGDPASVVAEAEQGRARCSAGSPRTTTSTRSSSSAYDWERYLATRNR